MKIMMGLVIINIIFLIIKCLIIIPLSDSVWQALMVFFFVLLVNTR